MHSDLNGFATVLRTKRTERGLSMAAFGELVGRSAAAIHAYENGDLPTAPVLPLFATALGVPLAELKELVAVERAARGDLAAVPTPAGSPIVRDASTTTSTEV
jgi:transcriptional regulator with XRE-family HTH domain